MPNEFSSRRRAPQNWTRAAFRPPPAFEVLTSLPVAFAPGGGGAPATVTLLHDYPDFAPAAGWRVEVAGAAYAVTGVAGKVLTCAEGGE